eukprot:scaffold1214_cov136-Isochrysis_galbana.AAC.4
MAVAIVPTTPTVPPMNAAPAASDRRTLPSSVIVSHGLSVCMQAFASTASRHLRRGTISDRRIVGQEASCQQ